MRFDAAILDMEGMLTDTACMSGNGKRRSTVCWRLKRGSSPFRRMTTGASSMGDSTVCATLRRGSDG